MRGRLGLCVAMTAALLLAGGCAKRTPEQKAAEKANKAAIAQAKADQKAAKKQAEAQAKADKKRMAEERERAEAQAQAAKKQAEVQAKADKKRAAEEAKLAKAQARKRKNQKPVQYADDEEWVIGHPYSVPENHPRSFDRHVQAMAAAGAADDTSLFDQHFDGGELNALGRAKVALMLQAAPKNTPLTIYVPTGGADERVQARLSAVETFWKDSKWSDLQVQARAGVDTRHMTPASVGLAGLRKMESGEGQGARSDNQSSGGSVSGSTTGSR